MAYSRANIKEHEAFVFHANILSSERQAFVCTDAHFTDKESDVTLALSGL